MAKLYARVDSDIRSGLGCRGNKRLEATILLNHTGGRSADGGVKLVATERGGRFTFKVTKLDPSGEELVYVTRFQRDGS